MFRTARQRCGAPAHILGLLRFHVLSLAYVLVLLGTLGVCNIASVRAADAPLSGSKIYFGMVYPKAPSILALQDIEVRLQHGTSLLLWYQSWQMGGKSQAFPIAQMNAARAHGSIPVLAWYPMDSSIASPVQPAFMLAGIIDGSWDPYIREYAREVKAWGHPFFLRFASEMNGSWIPWSEMTNGNKAGQFVQAWRHVHDIFTQIGAANATWTWCPNVEDSTTTPLDGLYPGNTYVDWACMDGYNFGPDLHGTPWRSFSQIFHGTYDHLLRIIPSSMPIMIGEMASSEHGGSKPEWITDAMSSQLPNQYPRVKGVIWFDSTNPGLDLRIDTSPESLAALRAALNSSVYVDNSYRYLEQSPIPAPEAVHPKPSKPEVLHGVHNPPAGYVQVLDTAHNRPIANARLTYIDGTSVATDTQGLAAMPDKGRPLTLQDITVGGGMMGITLLLDRRAGYQVRVDLASGTIVSVYVHNPTPLPAHGEPIAALQSAPAPWSAMIGLAVLTLLMAVGIGVSSGLHMWRERAHSARIGRDKVTRSERVSSPAATRRANR